MDPEPQSPYSPSSIDLERKLAEAFPNDAIREAARTRLLRYGREDWHREPDRVRLAILKLGGSDLAAIDRQVEAAGVDYRDILAQAEYPAYSRLPPGIDPAGSKARAAISSDRRQYLDWMAGR
jgi:hypothetical protein